MSPDGPSGWTLYALDQKQRAESIVAERAVLHPDGRPSAARPPVGSLPKTVPTPEMPAACASAGRPPPQAQGTAHAAAAGPASGSSAASTSTTGAIFRRTFWCVAPESNNAL
jgi:hypothetical protein